MEQVLTDAEWLDAMYTDGDALPMCCAVISELRDDLISIVRNDGRDLGGYYAKCAYETWLKVLDAHEGAELPVIAKLMAAIKEKQNL